MSVRTQISISKRCATMLHVYTEAVDGLIWPSLRTEIAVASIESSSFRIEKLTDECPFPWSFADHCFQFMNVRHIFVTFNKSVGQLFHLRKQMKKCARSFNSGNDNTINI